MNSYSKNTKIYNSNMLFTNLTSILFSNIFKFVQQQDITWKKKNWMSKSLSYFETAKLRSTYGILIKYGFTYY